LACADHPSVDAVSMVYRWLFNRSLLIKLTHVQNVFMTCCSSIAAGFNRG
jgi:hypothetical protein